MYLTNKDYNKAREVLWWWVRI